MTGALPTNIRWSVAQFGFIHFHAKAGAAWDGDLAVQDFERVFQNAAVKKLRAVQRRWIFQVISTVEGEARGERNIRVRQSAAEKQQSGILQHLDLPPRFREAAATGDLHGHAIQQAELDERFQLD